MAFFNDDNRRGPSKFGSDRKRNFGRSARPNFDEGKFNRDFPDKPRDDFKIRHEFRTPNEFKPRNEFRSHHENVVTAIGDANAAPQVAVGGIKEVEALLTKDPMRVHRVLFMHLSGNPKLYGLQKLAKRAHVHVQQVDSKILDSYARPNQGVVALMNEKPLLQWEDIRDEFFQAKERNEKKLIAVATNIEDPRNLGACIRSCLALGVDIFLIPAKGMCGITPSVARTSAGALEKMRICRPNNLEAAIGELKLAGYQILGLDADTETNLADFQFSDQVVISVGGEDVGLPPFIKKQCDAILRIPMNPDAHSYNASVALSLGLYEYARLRINHP